MKKRRKWWSIGLIHYSNTVRIYFMLTLFLFLSGSRFILNTFELMETWRILFSILIVLAFIFCSWQYAKKAKKEYELKNLGEEENLF
ncbi:hypothetical protein [Bacillus sp. FJAT-27251]|uniref:hypothetical protein n=1 Tax=Bacillus sp. FJAT-27251 TaxID=1684142 RepID=UPI0006A7E44C|nr:hypothetical protein [Bacillus sp. FJAT-27251]